MSLWELVAGLAEVSGSQFEAFDGFQLPGTLQGAVRGCTGLSFEGLTVFGGFTGAGTDKLHFETPRVSERTR